jgi:hypothetical protein
MITIKKDGLEITVETIEEYKLVMAAESPRQNGSAKTVFLKKQFLAVLDLFKQFPQGLNSSEIGSLLEIPDGTAGSRCARLAKMGLIVRRNGHHGYLLSDNFDSYHIVETSREQ